MSENTETRAGPATLVLPDDVQVCPHCLAIVRLPAKEPDPSVDFDCPHCGEHLPSLSRARRARHWTIFWAFVGLACLIPGFLKPMLIIEQPDVRIESGFIESLKKLWESGDRLVVLVVGIASGALPLLKLVVLILLAAGLNFDRHRHRRLYKVLHFTGNWSMTEIQVVSMFLFWWKGSALYSLEVGPGVAYLIGMIIATKFSTMAYHHVVDWRNVHGAEA